VTPHAEFNIWFNAEAEERQYSIAEMILLKRAKVRVETNSELTRGQMSIDSRPVPKTGANAWVALQVDRGKFFISFVENSSSYSQPPSFREGEIPNFKEKSGI
jgi:inosine-uridine nucleoside N-ribohydrolase